MNQSKKVGRPRKYNLTSKYDLTTKEGQRNYGREYRKVPEVKERIKSKSKVWAHNHYLKVKERDKEKFNALRNEVFSALGNKCKCCGETERACLHIHHINEELKPIRGNGGLARWFKYQNHLKQLNNLIVLCANCHMKLHAGIIMI